MMIVLTTKIGYTIFGKASAYAIHQRQPTRLTVRSCTMLLNRKELKVIPVATKPIVSMFKRFIQINFLIIIQN